ncbi:MAG TPA: A24 family peptidase [Xanthomonadales bacterium]|nr:A24 family peptidase [Xanthomonadales bacterium]
MSFITADPAWAAATAGLFGLLVGSFLNVVILRLPARLEHEWRAQSREVLELDAPAESPPPPADLVFARSHCPKCGHQLAWYENIPLLSFLALRGRCRACRTPISWQYPAVEAMTGIASAVVVWHYGPTAQALVALVATWMLIALTGIDLRTQLLPDQITLPLLWLGLLASVHALFREAPAAIVGAAAGYLVLWSVYWAFKLLTGKEGMGYGDFKLLGALGAFVGWQGIVPILLLSSVIGAVTGSIWLAVRGRDRATPIPFGPYLAAAGWVQLLWGETLLDAYARHSGL